MTGYRLTHVQELEQAIGEDGARGILSNFSCPLNPDVECFLKQKAMLFSHQGWSQTHLVFTSFRGRPVLAGYFTLANKFIAIPSKKLSASTKKKLAKYSTYDDNIRAYCLAIPLLAQLGKNYTNGYNSLISGDELMELAFKKINHIQYNLGGRFVYLECEDKPKLIQFYSAHGFVEFDRRLLDPDETGLSGNYLVQMLKMFREKHH
jgi:hypothetical protein